MENPYGRGSLQFDDAGHLLNEIPCISCSYILRGMTLDRACPECGTAVGRSVKGDFLKFAAPMWVSKLASGMNWIIGAIIASIVLGCIGSGISRSTDDETIASMLELAAGIISVIGFWLLTTPDPGTVEPSPINTRTLTRYSMLAAYLLSALAVALGFLSLMASIGMLVLAGLVDVASVFFCGFFAVHLARRIPNKSLATQSKIVMVGMAVMYLSAAALGLFVYTQRAALTTGSGLAPTMLAMAGGAIVVGVTALVFSIWTLVLIIVFRNKLTQAATDARRTWASEHRTPVDIAQWEQQTALNSSGPASTGPQISPDEPGLAADQNPQAVDPNQWPDEPGSQGQGQEEGDIDMSQWPDDPPVSN